MSKMCLSRKERAPQPQKTPSLYFLNYHYSYYYAGCIIHIMIMACLATTSLLRCTGSTNCRRCQLAGPKSAKSCHVAVADALMRGSGCRVRRQGIFRFRHKSGKMLALQFDLYRLTCNQCVHLDLHFLGAYSYPALFRHAWRSGETLVCIYASTHTYDYTCPPIYMCTECMILR